MPLIRTDQTMILVEGVPLFFICADDFFKAFPGQRVCLAYSFNQFINISPAVFIKSNSDDLGLMPQIK